MASRIQESAANLADESIPSEKLLLRTLRTGNVDEEAAKSLSASPKKSFMFLRSINFRMGYSPRISDLDKRTAKSPSGSPKKSLRYLKSIYFRLGSSSTTEDLNKPLATFPNVRTGNTRRSIFARGSPKIAETYQCLHCVESNSQACSSDPMPSLIHSQFESKILPKPFLIKNQAKLGSKTCKMLVTVNVPKSTGPLKFVVDVNDPVSRVIELALRAYAREGRLPALGLESSFMQLYSCNFEALDPLQLVGSVGARQFFLHRKHPEELEQAAARNAQAVSMPWKLWWNVKSTIVCSA